MNLWNDRVDIRWHRRLPWCRAHFYTPTCLHKYGFAAGPITIWAVRDFSGRGLRQR